MIFFCEECGERYVIEPENIKEAALVVFACRVCNDTIEVSLPELHPSKPPAFEDQTAETGALK